MRIRLRHQRLRQELAKSGRSQNAWALALGLDSGHFSKLVNGQRRYPGAPTRTKLLEGLGLEFDELFVVEAGPRRFTSTSRPEPVFSTEASMSFGNDVRYAFRMMAKHPGFSALIVLIVAVGVGANTAVFGLVHAVLLSPLPFPESERLVLLWTTDEARGGGGAVSFPDYLDWSSESETFETLAAFQEESFILGGDDGAERVPGEMVTPEYFRLLGVEPMRGRIPMTSEVESSPNVVLLGEALAERRFEDPDAILGRTIDVNDESFLVIAVLPRTFEGFSGEARLWVPMWAFDALNPELVQYEILDRRGTRWHRVLGRLRQGVELEEAEAEMSTIAADLAESYPRFNESRGVGMRHAHDEVVSDQRASLLALSTAVGVLLLLACVNLANLFWLRVLSRRNEVAIRMALGANRARLVRQLLTETASLSVCGGVAGIVVARLGSEFLVAFAPVTLPGSGRVGLDTGVFAFAMGLAVVTGVAFGSFPALTAARTGSRSALVEGSRMAPGRRSALAGFALAEIAIATLLLIGAGLVVKSFYKMQRFEAGFVSSNLLTMQFNVPRDAPTESFLERVVIETAAVPGVESSSIASHVYFGPGYMSGDVTVEGFEPSTPADEIQAYWHYVSDDYFRTMGIPLLDGEAFGPSENVAVVNRSFAERMWPDDGAIGKRLARGSKDEDDPWLTIVGVVGDVTPRLRVPETDRLPQIYFPVRDGGLWSRWLLLRTATEPASVVASVRAALRELHPGMAVFAIATMDELLSRQRSRLRHLAYLMGGFSLLALFLAALGLYGVIGYAVRQLTHEIGIRVAVGASRADVVALVMKPAAVIIGVGLAVGLTMSFGATRFAASLLYEVDPLDASTFAAVAAGLSLVALAASYVPARRAARVDPVQALRHE